MAIETYLSFYLQKDGHRNLPEILPTKGWSFKSISAFAYKGMVIKTYLSICLKEMVIETYLSFCLQRDGHLNLPQLLPTKGWSSKPTSAFAYKGMEWPSKPTSAFAYKGMVIETYLRFCLQRDGHLNLPQLLPTKGWSSKPTSAFAYKGMVIETYLSFCLKRMAIETYLSFCLQRNGHRNLPELLPTKGWSSKPT
ncbi:hypothetical protein CHS0354_008189 [Potamilus streckersoni]|uniref:Uncharacterized protein n=1 Tax=Potamilus streckersoni TaxID=2493646 RepID=A0AAE0RWE0_9BIVA|nr:hypothetical protein CHS0354_008189 [Potamilus streckersoni]